jgi:3-methyladenine DNA glycosylase/8-oxoguanine DNA glycosylase
MPQTSTRFKCPEFYDLFWTCHAHGWKNLAPFSWDDRKQRLRFAVLAGKKPMDVTVRQAGNVLVATVATHRDLPAEDRKLLRNLIARSLALDMDTSALLARAEKVGAAYADMVQRGAGRMLRSPTLWEDAAKTLFTTNCTWALTRKMCSAACSRFFSQPTPSGAFPFPPPQAFLSPRVEELKRSLPVGYRAGYLKHLARRFAADPSLGGLETKALPYAEAARIVGAAKGFGSYATNHLLLLAGYYEEIPVDTVVTAYLKKAHRVRKPLSFIKRHYARWGRYRWWGLTLERMLHRHDVTGDGKPYQGAKRQAQSSKRRVNTRS